MKKRVLSVRFIKLAVIAVFVLTLAIFSGKLFPESKVQGQGGSFLPAPNNVSATDNQYHDKVGVYWDAVRGANLYRIFRNTTNSTTGATDVGTTQANYFFDTAATVGQNYFYWVKSENGATVSNFSQSEQGTRANGMPADGIFLDLQPPSAPAGNQITAAKAYLGKTLFWDEQLSSTKTVSCGTCHQAGASGSDPRTNSTTVNPGFDNTFNTADDIFGSLGVPQNNQNGTYVFNPAFGFNLQVTDRKSPSYLNAAYAPNGIFWDGRASDTFRDPLTSAIILPSGASLESQVLGPPLSAAEMAHGGRDWTQVAQRVAASKPLALAMKVPNSLGTWINGRTYPQLFEEAFGTSDVTPTRIAMAIATHERTLFSDQTPLDKAVTQITPMTKQEEFGSELFLAVSCAVCHGGALLSDNSFHNIGVRPQNEDAGRFAVTGLEADRAKFKTPNLRNIEFRAPYMHNGRFATLEEVVEFYNRGGDHSAPNIDTALIRPLGMTADQKAALVAFMKRPLNDNRVTSELSPFDRPRLFTQTSRVPFVSGTGIAGTGGNVPQAVAIEPPYIGNPSFTVAVSRGLGGANAVLAIHDTDPGTSSIPATGSFARVSLTLSGTGAGNGNGSVSLNTLANNPQFVGRTFYGRWYVTDPGAIGGFSVSGLIKFTVFTQNSNLSKTFVDFDGDRKTDISIFRPNGANGGEWWFNKSESGGNAAFQFGAATDKIVPADYTGDGKTDVAVWRPSTGQWFIMRSEDSSFYAFPFGANGDIPVAGDFDGDGKFDPTIFRPSTTTWFIQASSQGTLIRPFGANNDKPQLGDYDGDGLTDLAIFRSNGASGAEWWIQRSSDGGVFAAQFGISTDKPTAADYTGDGKTDIAFWRPSTGFWYVLRS
ncbi:MAG TPA: cytochrome c peroxidase, partial [Pyrinomonadaceae bacterium]|nr:cytochrome c peroxidase [Pyrinomonadaceae bacterium]